ncbi:hemagglutinin repeat-containing protein [Agrobacterium sp. LAD9]|uniref:hemagglutinin repeat-containing protein n=1 Tax=Agrobacterium sp. LAD9 TaxID=2055153 RepID=UPI000D1F70BC|nr:hemagglutinin repeat-containing protein [Agrobacterium sp. LAD9]
MTGRQIASAFRASLASILSISLIVEPIIVRAQELSGATGVSPANQPRIEAAGNGVPMVNIVTPNAAGLSHNKYDNFNVGAPGLILNNSNGDLNRSQLGGLVQGNTNLGGSGPARVILNEVVGANRSLLQGATEVFGRGADVVIANPNGLTCNGCGFINSPRVTLSTGTPELGGDGSLRNLRVERGDVTIRAGGADLSQSDIFDIVSRKISVNGPVNARGEINLAAGRNAFDYAAGTVTSLGSDGNEPEIAIDSSLLGGMYAGRIKIIATDKGAGVNMKGNMAANAGAMTLTADGKLTLGKTYASKSIAARSASRSVTVESTLFSDEAVVLEGKSIAELAADALVGAKGDVTIKGQSVVVGAGALAASGLDANGVQSALGRLDIQAEELNAGKGRLFGGSLLSIAAGSIDISRDTDNGKDIFRSLGLITIDARRIDAANGRATANGNLTLSSESGLAISGGRIVSGGMLLATAANLSSSATLAATDRLQLTSRNGDLVQSGSVQANGIELTSASDLTNSGKIVSTKDVKLTATGAFDNTASGVIAAQGGELVVAGTHDVSNSGTMTSSSFSTVSAGGGLNNGGTLVAAKSLELIATGNFDNSASGVIAAQGGELAINGTRDVSNSGAMTSSSSATVSAGGGLNNGGTLAAAKSIKLTAAGAFDNAASGVIAAQGGELVVTGTRDVSNFGRMTSSSFVSVSAGGGLRNGGKLVAAKDVRLTATGNFDNVASGVIAARGGELVTTGTRDVSNSGTMASSSSATVSAGAKLSNSGTLVAGKNLELTATGNFDNSGSGVIAAQGGELSITGMRDVSNSGAMTSSSSATVSAGGGLSNGGTLAAAKSIKLTATGSFDNAASGVIAAQGGELVVAGTRDVSNFGRMTSSSFASVSAGGGLSNGGKLVAAKTLDLTAAGSFNNTTSGVIAAQGGELVITGTRDVSNFGALASSSSTTVSAGGGLSNGGKLVAAKNVTLTASANFDNAASGTIAAQGGELVVTGTRDVSNSGTMVSSSSAIVSAGAKLSNGGTLVSMKNVALTAAGNIGNAALGVIAAQSGELVVTGTRDVSNSGTMTSSSFANVSAGGTLSNSGTLVAAKNLDLTATGDFDNTASGTIEAQGGALVLTGRRTVANTGTITGLSSATVSASGLNNSGRLTAADALVLKVGDTVINGGTLQGGGVTLNATSLENRGLLTAKSEKLSATIAGNVRNSGELSARGDLGLGLSGDLVNSGRLVSVGAMTLSGVGDAAMQAFTNEAGALVDGGGGLTLRAASLVNAGTAGSGRGNTFARLSGKVDNSGLLYSAGWSDIGVGDDLSNTGEISTQERVRLSIVRDLNNSGKILATSTLDMAAGRRLTNEPAGVVQAAAATIEAGSLINRGRLTARQGGLEATIRGDVENAGEFSARDDLTLKAAGNLTNSGTLLSLGNMTLAGLGDGAMGAFSNTGLVNGDRRLTIRAASLTNPGRAGSGNGALLAYLAGDLDNAGLLRGAGSTDIDVGGALINRGELSTQDGLTLDAAGNITNSGKMIAANRLAVATAAGMTNEQAGVLQGDSLAFNAASLNNGGTLTTSGGRLEATIAGDVTNVGELSSRGDLTLATPGRFTNTGRLVSLGSMDLVGTGSGFMGAFTNAASGLVNGHGGLSLNAASLDNAGTLGSGGGDLTVKLGGNLANTGFLYAGRSAFYNLDGSFTNTRADVIAERDLTIRGLSRNRAGDLVNRSGLIQTNSGNMDLRVASIVNTRDGSVSVSRLAIAPVVTVNGNVTTTVNATRDMASISGTAAQIISGDALSIDTDSLTNSYSLLSARTNMAISAGSVLNEGRDLIETVDTTVETLHSERYCAKRFLGKCLSRKTRTWTTSESSTSTQTYNVVFGTIEAGGALNAVVTGYLLNNAVRQGAGQTGTSSGRAIGGANVAGAAAAGSIDAASLGNAFAAAGMAASSPTSANVMASSIPPVNIAATGLPSVDTTTAGILPASIPVSLPGIDPVAIAVPRAVVPLEELNVSIEALTGRKAIFEAAASPSMPFVIETRSQFIDPSKFLGSDYFLSRIGGYRPEANIKRLGDGYFEYRLVADQIFAKTGGRTIGSDVDPARMMQSLYDNAVDEQRSLGLSGGISLSAGQISSLKKDIVWLEKQSVNGAEVLVPRLYLAKATIGTIDVASARIRGGSVAIEAGGMGNSGTLFSGSSLAIASSGSLLNDGGSLFAKSDVIIDARGSFTNRSGLVSGDNISIRAASIVNDTLKSRDITANGFTDRAQQTARIAAANDLLLSASGSISSVGGQFAAGGDLTLKAGAAIDIAALGLEFSRDDRFKGGYDRAASLKNTLAELQTGGNLILAAGEDLMLAGVKATAGESATLSAGGDVTIASVQDTANRDMSYSGGSRGLFSSRRQVRNSENSTTEQSSVIAANDGLTIAAGRDATISASRLEATGGKLDAAVAIDAGRDIVIASGLDTLEKQSSSSSRGLLSSRKSSSQSHDETNVASAISTSGNISLNAGRDAAISGSKLDAGGSVAVEGDSVSALGAQERDASGSSSSKSGLFVGSGGGFVSLWGSKSNSKEQFATTNVASSINAGQDVTLEARGTDVNIIGSNVTAGRDIALNAARDVNVTPGSETSGSSEEKKRSGFGLSFSSGSGSLSVGVGYAKVSDKTSQSQEVNAVSRLTAGRDLTINAGRDANLQAARAEAGRDAVIQAVRDVNLLSAIDRSNYARMHEELFAGVTLSVGSKIPDAIRTTADAAKKFGNIRDGYSAANAGFAALKAYDALSPVVQGNVASASLTAGFQASKQTETLAASSPSVTAIQAGNSVSIDAGTGDINATGAQITAGSADDGNGSAGDIRLAAGRDINLKSAEASSSSSSSSRSASASIGVGANLNLTTGVSAGLTGGAAVSSGSATSASSTQVITRVDGAGDVTLQSGRDTTLAGAVVSGGTVRADVGRNLEIASVPDTGTRSNKSASAGISLGSNPISGVQIGGGKGSGATNWISEQSGLVSDGAMDVTVGGDTHLDAGKIVSNNGNLKLSTGTLTHENFEGEKRYEGVSASVGIDLTGGSGTSANPVGNSTLEGTYKLDDTRQSLKATVGPGEITIRDPEQQASLESGGTTAPLSELNRDPGRAEEITRDRHVEIDAYLSTDSLRAAAKGVEVAGKALGEAFEALGVKLAASGDLTPAELQTARKVAKALDAGTLDIAALATCSGRQGFNLLDLIFTPAYAASGCVLYDTNGKEIAELTASEREACVQMLATLMEEYTEKYATGEAGKGELPSSVKNIAEQLRKVGSDEELMAGFQVMGLTAGFMRSLLTRLAIGEEGYKELEAALKPLKALGGLSKEASERAITSIAAKHGLSEQDTKDLKLVIGVTTAAIIGVVGVKPGRGGVDPKKETPESPRRPTPKESEVAVGTDLGAGARPQVSFKDGKEVPYGTPGSVRPDWCRGDVCSAEVKNYNVANNMNGLIDNVAKQAIQRQRNLPSGMQQEIVIDVRGQVVTVDQERRVIRGIVQKSNGAIKPESIEFKRDQ